MDSEARKRHTEFVDARLMGLHRLGYVLTGDQHAAEDLVQTVSGRTTSSGDTTQGTAFWHHMAERLS